MHKHVMEDAICDRCGHPVEDRNHAFFACPISPELWNCIGFSALASTSDIDAWSFTSATGLDKAVWPSVLITILWRLWDARNGAIFRGENLSARNVISRVCDDFSPGRAGLLRQIWFPVCACGACTSVLVQPLFLHLPLETLYLRNEQLLCF